MTDILQFPVTTDAADAALVASTVAQWNAWGGFAAWKAADPNYQTLPIPESVWKRHPTLPLWWVDFQTVHVSIGDVGRAALLDSLAGTPITKVEGVDLVALGYVPAYTPRP
jgi:hypothetical protein